MADRRQQERAQKQYSNAKELMEKEGEFSLNTLVIPTGHKLFRFRKTGRYRLDFLPFVAGVGNPEVQKGVWHYQRIYYAHRNINETMEVCLFKTFGEPCPRCEQIAEWRRQGIMDQDSLKELSPKDRKVYAVIDLDDKDAGIQIFECGHYKTFGELLKSKIEGSDMGYESFFHLDDGLTLCVNVKDDKWAGGTFKKPTNIEMAPRRKPYADDFIKKVPCLDKCIRHRSYEELAKLCEENVGKKKTQVEAPDTDALEPEVDDKVTFEYKGKDFVGVVTKVLAKKKLAYVKCSDRPEPHTVEWADLSLVEDDEEPDTNTDVDDDDDDDDEPTPPKKGGKKKPAPEPEEDDENDEDETDDEDDAPADDDDDEDDDEDEPVPLKKGKKKPAPPADDDDDDDAGDDDDGDEDADDDDDDIEPATSKPSKKGAAGKKPSKPADDDDEEDDEDDSDWMDDDDDDEPTPPKKPAGKKGKKK